MSAENLPTEMPPAPAMAATALADAFVAGVKRLAQEFGVTSTILVFGIEQTGKLQVFSEALGIERAHAELAAQAYAAHVLPIVHRAETLNRIASTPARAAGIK